MRRLVKDNTSYEGLCIRLDHAIGAKSRNGDQYHPDRNPDDEEAADEFAKVQAAYDVLKTNEDMRQALG